MKLWTNSRAYRWRDCKYRHHLEYVDGWRPKKQTEALHMGILFHLGLEKWWGVLMLSQQEPEAFTDTFGEDPLLKVMLVQALGAVAGKAWDESQQVRVEEMLIAYHQRWKGAVDDYEVLSVEQTWTAPMVNPESGRASRTWMLGGKWDVIARHRGQERTVIIEHKSCDEEIDTTTADYWLKLRMDNQISQYYVGAQGLGHEIDGCLYDVCRRPRSRPKAIKQVRKKKSETDAEFAARKEVEGRLENAEEFRARVRADFAERPDYYLQRMYVDRTQADLNLFAWDTWEESKIAHNAETAGRAPRNPSSCLTFGQCPFWEHCSAGVELEQNDRFEKIPNPHPELDQGVVVGVLEGPDQEDGE